MPHLSRPPNEIHEQLLKTAEKAKEIHTSQLHEYGITVAGGIEHGKNETGREVTRDSSDTRNR
jgi:hypothetical protein